MRKILTIFILLLSSVASAQYFSTGQDPASLKWRQIRSHYYQIIYPSGYDSNARRLSRILDLAIPFETQSLKSRVPRIPFVLHTRTVISNGVTVWAPHRIELYTCPPQDSYAEEWLEQLALHEYRHAVQTSKINRYFTRALYYIFGEQVVGAVLGLYVPPWFLEGDATVMETALSNSGRGRLPSFSAPLRAQVMEKGIYSYDKAVLGSYKTFTPDAYTLGYNLVSMGRLKYGIDLWDYTLDRVARYPFMVVPFASGIKRKTGLSKTGFYKSALNELKSKWVEQDRMTPPSDYRLITRPDRKNYCVYIHPLYQCDTLFVAMKRSMDDVDYFVQITPNGKEKKLIVPGDYQEGSSSIGGGKLAWAEATPDVRWDNRNNMSIRVMDLESGKTRTLIRRARLIAPCLSPDGKQIITVGMGEDDRCSMVLLDASTGETLKTCKSPEGVRVLTPYWSPDGKLVSFTWLDARGNSIGVFDPETGTLSNVLPFTYHQVSSPSFVEKDLIMFSSDYSGIENFYVLNTTTGKIYQTTSSRFGATDPDFNSSRDRFIYDEIGSDGFQVVEAPIDSSSWIPLDRITDRSYKLYNAMAEQEKVNVQDTVEERGKMEEGGARMNSEPRTPNIERKYSKLGHLFNVHSWAPVSFSLSNQTLHPGVMVLSQNVLNTLFASAGYDYDLNERTGKFYAGLSYRGLYPVFDIRFDIGDRAGYAVNQAKKQRIRFTWQEMNFSAAASIPWNFSFGSFYRYLTPSIGTTLINAAHNSSTPEQFTKGLIQSLDYKLSFSQYFRTSGKDINPKWGQYLSFIYRNTPFDGNDMGSVLGIQGWLYFPGIFRHHSLGIYGAFQQRVDPGKINYVFSDVIGFPRGYSDIYDPRVYSLSFNYALPLFYPDWSVGSLFYFKRFKLNLFFDYAEGWQGKYYDKNALSVYKSTGAELTTDFHFLRFLYPIELGVRSIYFPGSNSWGFEMVYSISY